MHARGPDSVAVGRGDRLGEDAMKLGRCCVPVLERGVLVFCSENEGVWEREVGVMH
jgi:hypothetical protein